MPEPVADHGERADAKLLGDECRRGVERVHTGRRRKDRQGPAVGRHGSARARTRHERLVHEPGRGLVHRDRRGLGYRELFVGDVQRSRIGLGLGQRHLHRQRRQRRQRGLRGSQVRRDGSDGQCVTCAGAGPGRLVHESRGVHGIRIGRSVGCRVVQRRDVQRARQRSGKHLCELPRQRGELCAPDPSRCATTRRGPRRPAPASTGRPTTASGTRSPSPSRSPAATRPPGSRPAPRELQRPRRRRERQRHLHRPRRAHERAARLRLQVRRHRAAADEGGGREGRSFRHAELGGDRVALRR